MSQTVKIDLNVLDSTGSLKARKRESDDLNASLETGRKLATGTRTGSQAAAAAFRGEGTEYGRARGSMGATGAGARDFANQAQGLGGLVRLYATYAANLFAVTAAFNALREAMNTTNMVEGLNQLGATSGVAMGNLAKQFAAASGGAISLRESMEATAKAVSSGLSQAQFLKLGQVAKQASQALGINMSDAVSRLTRGITKLEPELLDELGIFTKVGKATEEYARSVGKAESSLTDFERRQAFANAVLEEGAKKFGEIDIPTNPYDKLLASLKNVAQTILETINKAIVPLIDILSSSPTALLAAIVGIGTKIVTQALPAITQYRKELKDSAEEAKKFAAMRSAEAREAYNKALEPVMQKQLAARAEAYLNMEDALNKVAEKSEKAAKAGRLVGEFRGIMTQKDISLVSDKDIDRIEKYGNSLKNKVNIYKEWADQAKLAKAAVADFDEELRKTPEDIKPGRGTSAGIALIKEERARRAAASKSIISQTSYETEVDGARAAFSNMINSIKQEKIGAVRSVFTALAGTISIVTTKVMGLAVAFGNLFAVVGIVITAYQLLTGWLGKNQKEAEKTSSSLELLEGSIDSVSATLDRLNKKPVLEQLSSDNLAARATAFQNLGTSLVQAIDDVEKEIAARNVVDVFSNWVSGVFGKSTEDRIQKQLAGSIDSALQAVSSSTEADRLQKYMASILSIPVDSTIEDIKKAAKKASPAIQKEVANIIQKFSSDAAKSAGSVKVFTDSLAESGKVYQDLQNTFKQNDAVSKFTENSTKQILEFTNVLGTAGLVDKLTLLKESSKDIRFLQLLDQNSAKLILDSAGALEDYSNELAQVRGELSSLQQGRQQAEQQLEKTAKGRVEYKQLQDVIVKYDELIAKKKESTKATEQSIATRLLESERVFSDALRTSLVANIERFAQGLQNAAAKARLELQKTNLQGITDPKLRVSEEGRLEREGIKLDIAQINTQIKLIESNNELRLAIQEAEYNRKIERRKAELGVRTEEEVLAGDIGLASESRRLGYARATRGMGLQDILKALKGGGTGSEFLSALSAQLPTAQAIAGAQQQLIGQRSKLESSKLKDAYNDIGADVERARKSYQDMLSALDQDQERFNQTRQGMTAAEIARVEADLATRRAGIQAGLSLLEPAAGFRKAETALAVDSTPANKENLELVSRTLAIAQETQNAQVQLVDSKGTTARISAEILELVTKTAEKEKQNYDVQQLQSSTRLELINIEQSLIQKQAEQGIISKDNLNSQLRSLELEKLNLETQQKRLSVTTKAQEQLDQINREVAQAGGMGALSAERYAEVEGRMQAVIMLRDLELNSITQISEKRKQDMLFNASLTDRQLAYGDMFKQSFEGMADAMVEWAKTGKLASKELFNSLIADLIRYELRLQMFEAYSAVRPGLMNFLGKLFGTAGVANPSGATGADMDLFYQAKGGAWDYGVQKFAKGGMFTNSIVDSPTLFKFAKGTGLMGEAGPEAIMPLKRDANGNLGVRAGGGGNVEVVVNNYSTAQAETRETTDSRGNRRIEIVVGEMVASEVARTGSQTQQAFMGTFGTRPAVARR